MSDNIALEVEKLADSLAVDRKRSIGEIAKELKVETHVIRFWEENFPQIKPEIGVGKRRYYYNKQLRILKRIKKFLHEDGYTIAGLQKLLKKRKKDAYKEEDLSVITGKQPTTSKAEIGVEDFIHSEHKVRPDGMINPKAKMLDFARIKVSAMDPSIREQLQSHVDDIRGKLNQMRSLMK